MLKHDKYVEKKNYDLLFYYLVFFFLFFLFDTFKFKLGFFFSLWFRFCCPICSKSVIDMSKFWKKLDEEVLLLLMIKQTVLVRVKIIIAK